MKALSFVAAIGIASAALAAGGTVKGSKHALSVTGPGPIKAESEIQSCVFCHVSHGGTAKAMGGRPDVGTTHRGYESSTLRGRALAPTGASRVCLSCHDGTIAVGRTLKGSIAMKGVPTDGRIPASRRSNLGTDLRSSHPVSMRVTPGPKVRGPSDPRVHLDGASEIQCTSCHDPHSEFGGTPEGRFLRAPMQGSQLCAACHVAGRGSHATAGATFTAAQGNETGHRTVAEAGCAACHRQHGADAGGRLLARGQRDTDDAPCLRCHAGGGNAADVARQVAKASSHAVDGGRAHDRSEGPDAVGRRLPETSAGAPRHVVCVDCHDPHDAVASPARPPFASGSLRGAWGVDVAGRRVEQVRFEYELCFKCHGDSANKPVQPGAGRARRRREDRNLRRVFDAGAASYHPVVAAVRAGDVPSLVPAYPPGSLVYCSDCHASDDGPAAGGKGARGPHGSIYAPLLERNYVTGASAGESPFAYALCYKCHDREILLSPRSAFRLHRRHVVDLQSPCSVCHSAHGVSALAGTPAQNAHLVDFDLAVVGPGRAGTVQYDMRGPRTGSCTLTCHGAAHDARAY
jgi:predicted CXXCH cytochrome family protein